MSHVTHRKCGLRFEKRHFVEIETWVRPDEFVRYGHRACWGADGNVVIERLCLSLSYVEKPFNSKVIKVFLPELRNRQVFFVFRDSYVIYIYYIWIYSYVIYIYVIYEHFMNIICTFYIFMYGYVTVANVLDCDIVVILNSSRSIAFTFGQIPRYRTPLSSSAIG